MGEALTKPIPTYCILGAGEILDYAAVAAKIPADAFVLCADGGYHHCGPLGIIPQLLLGDFDSIEGTLPAGIPRISLPVAKNYTDSAFAVEEVLQRGGKQLLMAGMLGGRLDHTLGNLQLLGRCASLGLTATITDGVTDIYAFCSYDARERFVLPAYCNHYFSLFSLDGSCKSVTINGAVYPLDAYPLGCLDPRAVSNEFQSGPVEIWLEGGVLLVVVTPK